MGGKTESEVKTIIKNKVSAEIENETKNITKIVNDTITNVSTSMVNETAASISIGTSAGNIAKLTNLVAKKGGKISVEQAAKVEAQNKAIIQIIMSSEAMNKLANQIIADINNKTKQDASAQQSMSTLAKIGELNKEGGGPEGIVNKLADTIGGMVKSLTGSDSSQKSDTEIENEIRTKLKNTTVNENDITSKIETNITQQMKQAAEAKCNLNTSADNVLEIDKAFAQDEGEISVTQEVSIKNFNDCFIKLDIGQKIANDLTNGFKTVSVSETENKASSEQKLKSESTIEKQNIQESGIMNTIDKAIGGIFGVWSSVIYMVGGIILVVVLIVGVLFFSGKIKASDFKPTGVSIDSSSEEEESSDLEGGGFTRNFYLTAASIALLIMISKKSIPLCGVILIVTFVYLMQKNN